MSTSKIVLLEGLINYSSLKNKVISKNIANAGTVNFKRQDVEFKDIFRANLNSPLKTTNEKHVGIVKNDEVKNFEIITDNERENISGVNNVDIDKEMSALAENTIRFKFAAREIGGYFKSLQSAIKGGA